MVAPVSVSLVGWDRTLSADLIDIIRFRMAITVRALFRRQSGRGWWIYLLLTVIYSMYVLFDHDDFEHTATWKLLLPIAALIGQISFPTLAGWILVFTPTLAYVVFA